MGVVHESVKNGISQGVVTDADIPLIGGELADHQRGCVAMAIIHNFHQVIALGRIEFFQPPIIDNDELYFALWTMAYVWCMVLRSVT
jgi:hypothetical protein